MPEKDIVLIISEFLSVYISLYIFIDYLSLCVKDMVGSVRYGDIRHEFDSKPVDLRKFCSLSDRVCLNTFSGVPSSTIRP